jgi:adenosylhomocysteine nucleosidase
MDTPKRNGPRKFRLCERRECIERDRVAVKILVTFAVDAEFAPWRKMRNFRKEREGLLDIDVYREEIDGVEVLAILTGIGGKDARVNATKIPWGDFDGVCISTGLAGSLRRDHIQGEILVARRVQVPGLKKVISCDDELVSLAEKNGAKAVEAFHTADHVVIDSTEKKILGMDADAVEMESGEILHEAGASGVKGVAVRCISDDSEEELPLDFNKVITQQGEVSMGRVAVEVARRPWVVPRLVKFGRQSRVAAEKLAEFLERFVPAVALELKRPLKKVV